MFSLSCLFTVERVLSYKCINISLQNFLNKPAHSHTPVCCWVHRFPKLPCSSYVRRRCPIEERWVCVEIQTVNRTSAQRLLYDFICQLCGQRGLCLFILILFPLEHVRAYLQDVHECARAFSFSRASLWMLFFLKLNSGKCKWCGFSAGLIVIKAL